MAKQKRGKRYSAAEKKEIIDFVESINAEKGRGGAAQASRKFNVSQLTIANWIKGSGATTVKAAKGGKSTSAFSAKLRKLADLDDEIAATKAKLASLEKEFAKLKKKL